LDLKYLKAFFDPVHLVEVLPGLGQVGGVLLEHKHLHALEKVQILYYEQSLKLNLIHFNYEVVILINAALTFT
jgi:hypothetical protein